MRRRLIAVPPVLAHPQFRILWIGESVSMIGSWTQIVATTWLAWQLSRSAAVVGACTAAGFLPSLVLAPAAGALADRWPRRRVLIITQAVAIAPPLALGALLESGAASIAVVIAASVANGVVLAFYLPARWAVVPDLLPRQLVPAAAGFTTATLAAARLSGSALGGILIAWTGPASCCWINAASYLAVLTSLAAIRLPGSTPAAAPGDQKTGRLALLREHPELRAPLVAVSSYSLFAVNTMTVAPLLAARLHAGAGGTGALLAANGAGALAASLVIAFRGPAPAPRMLPAACVTTGALVMLGAAPSLTVALAAMAGAAGGYARLIATATARLQTGAPPALRGRVMGMHATALLGVAPAGNLVAGAAAQLVGAAVSVASGGALALVVTLLAGAGGHRSARRSAARRLGQTAAASAGNGLP